MGTIPHINNKLKQLDEIVRTEFITEISETAVVFS